MNLRSPFETQNILKWLLCFFPFLLCSQTLDVSLNTKPSLCSSYISRIYTDPSEWNWRYFEELRSILEFDLNTGGYTKIAATQELLEDLCQKFDTHQSFPLEQWKKEQISSAIYLSVEQKRLSIVVFNIEKESFKRYPDIFLSGEISTDRRQIHKLADTLHQDLFGAAGISSLKIMYTQRYKNTDTTEGLDYLSEIHLCDADGANSRQVTSKKGYCMSPGFLKLSTQDLAFYYVFNDAGQSKIYRGSLTNPDGDMLVSLRGNQALPALSKSGHMMAFITDVAGRPDLFIQHFDSKYRQAGKARQLYSSPRGTQASPTFNPNGKEVAFVSDKDGSPRIYVINIPSPKDTHRPRPRLLTLKYKDNTCPSWSPDGKKLAYSAKIDGVRQICLYDFAKEEEIQLTFTPEMKENPSWAPNSLHLIYNTESEESCELYLIHLTDPNPVQISKGFGQKRFPCFEIRH